MSSDVPLVSDLAVGVSHQTRSWMPIDQCLRLHSTKHALMSTMSVLIAIATR